MPAAPPASPAVIQPAPWRTISPAIAEGREPSATRTPNSRSCEAARAANIPYTPIDASSSARIPKPLIRTAGSCRDTSGSLTIAPSVSARVSGRDESIAAISRCTSFA